MEVTGLVGVTMCMTVSPEEIRNTERGIGLIIGNRELINSNVTSLWDIQVEMAAGTRREVKAEDRYRFGEAFLPRWC